MRRVVGSVLLLFLSQAHGQGVFESQSDVGSIAPPGTATFNAAADKYTLTAAGANTWYHVDCFHYLWKKSSGDQALSAEIDFPPVTYNHSPDPHRKGILMFRQTLDAGGTYVGVAQHGSGLMALQFRRQRGANSEDIELNIEGPKTACEPAAHSAGAIDSETGGIQHAADPLHQ